MLSLIESPGTIVCGGHGALMSNFNASMSTAPMRYKSPPLIYFQKNTKKEVINPHSHQNYWKVKSMKDSF